MERGSQFIHQKDSKLHISKPVEHEQARRKRAGETISHKPADKLDAWLGVLERIHSGGGASEARQAAQPKVLERIKELYRKPTSEGGYITGISDKAIRNYLHHQAEIAHEGGHGNVDEIMQRVNPQVEAEARETIVTDQTRSLDRWVDYLSSDNASYPAWFKYYVFKNITKLATYDKEKPNGKVKVTGEERPKGGFPARSADTTAPFPDINREALAYMEDSLAKHYGLKVIDSDNPNDQIDEKTLHVLNNDSSFASLYKRAIEYAAPKHQENLNVTDGTWVKFEQTDDLAKSDELAHSLHGYGTGWCTAGEGMAHTQLSGGDFYVYYTKGEDGQHSVPRVAIRMQNKDGKQSIAEVRGIEAEQNLEGALTDIAQAKMLEVDPKGAESYTKKAADMRQLTEIEKLLNNNLLAELSDDDLTFLYELKAPIEGFGYERDPRIDKIIGNRMVTKPPSRVVYSKDAERLKPLLVEALREQVENSRRASNTIIEQLNAMRPDGEKFLPLSSEQYNQAFEAKWQEWQSNGTLEYIIDRFINHNDRYTLVGTPAMRANGKQIIQLAQNFADGQGQKLYLDEPIFHEYSVEELSGSFKADQLIRFSLIPDNYTDELGNNTVANSVAILNDLKAGRQNLQVPAVLDDWVYYETLRQPGRVLESNARGDKTCILHFDMQPKMLNGELMVPFADIDDDGTPFLISSDPLYEAGGRLSIG